MASYPDLPNNRLIINGVDISETYGMILVDGYTLSPPSPKTYTVDIPGGNGVIDLTEAVFGDVVYNNRSQSFTFMLINPNTFESVKTDIFNFLQGRKYSYTMTMDPGYTYTGRFTVSSCSHSMYDIGKVGAIQVSVDAEPYKYKSTQTSTVTVNGTSTISLNSGRKKVIPTFTTTGNVTVTFGGTSYSLESGSSEVHDICFSKGSNSLTLTSTSSVSVTITYEWGDI